MRLLASRVLPPAQKARPMRWRVRFSAGCSWRRIRSNVIIFLENTDPEKPIKKIEKIVHEESENDFQIHIAGPPYVVELIRRSRRAEANGTKGWAAWVAAREEQWRGIVYPDVIIAAGFAIFVLSDFPPTQRFGMVVLAGCIIDILANLFVLPLLGSAQWKKK